MRKQLPKALTDAQANEITDKWEAEGYVFKGNGFLDSDDPPECPMCGETGFFYALWEHPTLKEEVVSPDGEQFSFSASQSFNRCYECGYTWIGED